MFWNSLETKTGRKRKRSEERTEDVQLLVIQCFFFKLDLPFLITLFLVDYCLLSHPNSADVAFICNVPRLKNDEFDNDIQNNQTNILSSTETSAT